MNNIQRAIQASKEKKEIEERNKNANILSSNITANRAKLKLQLKVERNAQGLTQRQLARKASLSQATITRAERHLWVSNPTLFQIAGALGKEIQLI
jgi:DNA-binding XRE family transcriptional regulator